MIRRALAGMLIFAVTIVAAILNTAAAQEVSGTGTATLSWTPPTMRENGDLLGAGELAGYVIWYGTESRDGRCASEYPDGPEDTSCYPAFVEVGNGGVMSRVLEFPVDGPVTMHFTIAAVDSGGRLSRYSNEATKTIEVVIDEVPPNAPVELEVELELTCSASEAGVTCQFIVQ